MKRAASILIFGAAAMVFGVALWRLLDLRFSAGDVYPPLSSFRADPLGAQAYYESLNSLSGHKVSRLLEPVHRLGSGSDTTLFFLGFDSSSSWLTSRTANELDDFLSQGGRLVLTFGENSVPDYNFVTNRLGPAPASPGSTNLWLPGTMPLSRRWHFELALIPSSSRESTTNNSYQVTATTNAPPEFSREIRWHSNIRLSQLGAEWLPVYADTNGPVLATRPIGKGWLIIATGSSFLHNQALQTARDLPLLAWLPGPSSRLFFDETHLGSNLDPGIMTLARRYRLHGLGLGLLLLAGLFIWQQATSLVPRLSSQTTGDSTLATHDAATGFINLLRRALPVGELGPECFKHWRESIGRSRPDLAPRVAAMQDLVNLEASRPPKERNPLEVYRRLTQILHRR